MVGLTDIDSNKYDAIIRFKKYLFSGVNSSQSLDNIALTARKVNEYGEIEIRRLSQQHKQLSDEEVKQVIEEYKNGMTTYQLAEKYGCHRQTISINLQKHGVKVMAGKIDPQDIAEIVRLYEDGLNTAEIAERFGVTYPTIIWHLHKHGVKMRTRWDY